MTTRKITNDCQPQFPCWLWSITGWHYFGNGFSEETTMECGFTHFSTLPADQKPEPVEPESFGAWERSQAITEEMNAPAPTQAVPLNSTAAAKPAVMPGEYVAATPSTTLTALAESAAREIHNYDYSPLTDANDDERVMTAILLRTFGPAFAKVEGERAYYHMRACEIADERDRLETENAAHIAIALSCGQSTVAGLKESLLREMHRNNQKDLPAGFDSWSAYHEHIVKLRAENAALRAKHSAAIAEVGRLYELARSRRGHFPSVIEENAALRLDKERLDAALLSAQSELIFWQEHNRDSESPMIGPGQNLVKTLAMIRAALTDTK